MKVYKIILMILLFVSACAPSTEEQATPTTTIIITTTATLTETPEATRTPTKIPSPTRTLTPTVAVSPTIGGTATFAFPTVTVNKQAHCRYGPSAAYLHAADLYPGDAGTVRGR